MRSVLVILCAAMFAASSYAADLTGHWLAKLHGPNGETRELSLYLMANGSSLAGYMSYEQENTPISNGTVTGNTISFATVHDRFGKMSTIEYKGTVSGGKLTLQRVREGQPGRGILYRQVSTETPKPMPPAPKKISLPPAKPVPYNGLAKTPPMGWNSWNRFKGKVSAKLLREIADAMVSSGMRDAGYIYVNIDDTWQDSRDAQGNIRPNKRFPDMKALAAYVHSKGLKLGIYSSPGPKTCAGYEGSFRHAEQDAKTYAFWGIDYLKYDWCSASQVYDYHSMQAVYARMGRALLHSGRPIVFSLCQYGVLHVEQWGASVGGNLWRTTGDINDTWARMSHIGFDEQVGLAKYAGPGHWNDPDMLEVGNGGMTNTEYRTHMSLWSLLAAPLLAGNDIRHMSKETKAILLNKEVIAVDQDRLGKEATRVAKNGDLEVWARPLSGGAYAVGLFNRGPSSAKVTAHWSDVGFHGKARVRDLWAHANRGVFADEFSAQVPSHGTVMIKVWPAK
ncbi:MAG TPA: glycoside hydrolase family 27 protein [Bryobacteraceae bacterium]